MNKITQLGLCVGIEREAEGIKDFDGRILAPIRARIQQELNKMGIDGEFELARKVDNNMNIFYQAVGI